MVSCPDGEYRFDFCGDDRRWCLQFIECITLPVDHITEMPYDNFLPLPDKEAWIRYEKVISKQVYLFCKAKELLGFDEALKWFLDGAGELLGAKSWVPFYDDRKALFSIVRGWKTGFTAKKYVWNIFPMICAGCGLRDIYGSRSIG